MDDLDRRRACILLFSSAARQQEHESVDNCGRYNIFSGFRFLFRLFLRRYFFHNRRHRDCNRVRNIHDISRDDRRVLHELRQLFRRLFEDVYKRQEIILKTLQDNGYPITFAMSGRADGGAIMRGNDILRSSQDVLVLDSLTGNAVIKMISAYTLSLIHI